MTRRRHQSGMSAALVSTLLLTAVLVAQQKPAAQKAPQAAAATTPDALLGQALHEEEVEGRLQNAIALYQKVMKTPGVTRAQAGRAQFRIGACYERLGLGEARKAYEAVVANYADQADLAAEAKARLAALAESVGRGGGPVLRQIWATRGGMEQGRISPDGRSVVGVDGSNGDLVIRSTATGNIRRLVAIPEDRRSKNGADSPVWSRDGRQIAYLWEHYSVELPDEFRIADAADGTSRVIPTDARFRLHALDAWSPDGRSVLARIEEGSQENRRRHLAWVPTSGGAIQLLASAGAGKDVGPAFLSPDGAWIVSRIPDDDVGFSVMAARGGGPRTLMSATASDELVGWSADGTHVLFLSREGALNDLMAVRVVNGQTAGRPFLLRTLQAFASLGVSQAGALLYQSTVETRMNLYRASFDMTSGRVGAPARVDVSTGRQNGSPSWSPDGRRLAYASWSQDKPARTLSIWSAETAQTRSFSLPFSTIRWSWHPTTWSADGRWVYVVGTNDVDRGTLQRVNTESGIVEAVVPWESAIFVAKKDPTILSSPFGWSPDARIIYKSDLHILVGTGLAGGAISAIVEHRLADRAERELFRLGPSVAKLTGSAVSPDGSQLAFGLVDYTAGRLSVMVMPAAGGPTRTVAEVPGTAEGVVRWTHDSRSIVFISRGGPEGRLMCDPTTGVVKTLTLAADMVQDIAFSPNGTEIAYVGGDNPDRGVWLLENFLPK